MFTPHQLCMLLLARERGGSRCVCVETLGCRDSTGGSAGPDSGRGSHTAATPKMSAHTAAVEISL